MQVNPAIVIAVGPSAEDVVGRARPLILRSTGHEAVPAIFQFLTVAAGTHDVGGAVRDAYRAATDKNAALSAERSGSMSVNFSRVESFVIAPLDAAGYEIAAEAARALRLCSRGSVSGGRNAIFLLPRRASPSEFADLQAVCDLLDSDVQSELTFNRCFFIDEVDESGQSVGPGDVVELVARFVSLAVASELSRHIRNVPPPYIGDGPPHKSYASFCCSTVGFDAQSLTRVLCGYLTSDICRSLFADGEPQLKTREWHGRVDDWLDKSLAEAPADPESADLNDLNRDVDYKRARERMEEFTRAACSSLRDNLRAYQGFLDHCLRRGVVRLEALSKQMKEIKGQINETEIMILLGHTERGESTTIKRTKRYPALAGVLGGAGLLTAVAMLYVSNFQPEPRHWAGIAVGALLLLAGVLLAFYKKEYEDLIPPAAVSPLEERLRLLEARYAEKNKLQNIHVELFTRLDLAYANLESLRRSVVEPELRRERGIFDVDIIDEELARKFYDEHYKAKDADIAGFTSSDRSDKLHDDAFSMLGVKLTESISRYCNDCFDRIGSYDLEHMFRLRESLGGYRELQTASSSFWYPKDPAESEKIVLARIPERSPDSVRTLLNNTFGAQNIRYVSGRDPFKATLIQIAYGQRLNNVLGHPPPNTNKTEKA